MQKNGAFKVVTDGYVTEESGTGVVHQAPYFGEVNFKLCIVSSLNSLDCYFDV